MFIGGRAAGSTGAVFFRNTAAKSCASRKLSKYCAVADKFSRVSRGAVPKCGTTAETGTSPANSRTSPAAPVSAQSSFDRSSSLSPPLSPPLLKSYPIHLAEPSLAASSSAESAVVSVANMVDSTGSTFSASPAGTGGLSSVGSRFSSNCSIRPSNSFCACIFWSHSYSRRLTSLRICPISSSATIAGVCRRLADFGRAADPVRAAIYCRTDSIAPTKKGKSKPSRAERVKAPPNVSDLYQKHVGRTTVFTTAEY